MMKLYIYDHCPYCVKARMIFGLKNIPVELDVLLNDDEPTPTRMVGKKVVPILQKDDGSYMPESMDIVKFVDKYQSPQVLVDLENWPLEAWLKTVGSYINQLLMPRYVNAPLPEFATPSARDYYLRKKEAVIGSFANHLNNTPTLLQKINADLAALESLIKSDEACNGELSADDIHLFAVLRGLSIVKGVVYPEKVDAYRKKMAQKSGVNLFDDIAVD
jgi:glutaredoxin 2